jgi:two-component system, chemotaxis family, chemotaxis protein CheY
MPYDLSQISVVIADDNLNMMAMVRGILKAFGVLNIRSFPDGQTAYNALEGTEVDFVVIDWMMEPLNGIEFTEKVRLGADSPNPFLPIIMLTGYTDRLRVFRARDAGVTEFMAKPISPKSLYARITAVIDRPRPFVRSENYFGPDRRRRVIEFQGADRRSTEAKIIEGDKAYADPGADGPPEEPAATAESDSSASSNTDVETSNGQ